MQVDFSTVICDLKGEIVKDGDKDLTLASACCTALMLPFNDEQQLPGDQKVRRYKIATKVVDGGIQDLTAEEITELKKVIAKAFGPLLVGRAYEILDPPKSD